MTGNQTLIRHRRISENGSLCRINPPIIILRTMILNIKSLKEQQHGALKAVPSRNRSLLALFCGSMGTYVLLTYAVCDLISPGFVAGSGKSILWFVVLHPLLLWRILHRQSVPQSYTILWPHVSMAYFYFDFKDADKQNHRCLLLSILAQLSAQSGPCFDVLFRFYSKHGSGTQKPGDGFLTQCPKEKLVLTDHDSTYIIVDALGECPNVSGVPSIREQVLQLLVDPVCLSYPTLQICVTGRPEIDNRTFLKPLAFRAVSLHDQRGQSPKCRVRLSFIRT
jgi:hypothetical protein